tara:strand:- start:658 stop:7254 length:6597 start_codon:yes stop_codon:yes gene_type:complete
MSIKDLFGRKVKSYDELSQDVESPEFIDKEVEERGTFIPPIDFSTASNFVSYGSAELYYKNSLERIYGEYPYDGSQKEKVEFQLSSSYLDRYLFDNKYPKSTGFGVFGQSGQATGTSTGYGTSYSSREYVYIPGGVRVGKDFSETARLSTAFEQNAVYDADNKRQKVFPVDLSVGTTVEFWLRKQTTPSTGTKEVILDLWNGVASGSSDYARMTIEIDLSSTSGAAFNATIAQGQQAVNAVGFKRQDISTPSVNPASLTSWNHYAVSFIQTSIDKIKTRFYVNGDLNLEQDLTLAFGGANINFSGLVNAFIGALQTNHTAETQSQGDGKLIADIDDFRFWKTRRTSRQIKINWNRQIGGGANTDDNTVDLGLYYKFNEGITTDATTDSTVLDYSGRIANGSWTGYQSSSRNTDSAFVLSGYGSEPGDPIIYATHPSVSALITEMQISGSEHDAEYGNRLYHTLPRWVIEQDQQNEKNLEKIYQIIATYFDQLHTQITALSTLKDKTYYQDNVKAPPFGRRLLEEKGFVTSDILVDSDILELFSNKALDSQTFTQNIDEIKNRIYINIYNNLEAILKSKGTERSIRNFIRCFGVDDEIIKLNVYTDEGMHYFSDKVRENSSRIRYIDFNEEQYSSATIFQTSSLNNPNTFISGSLVSKLEQYSAFTFEADLIVPFKIPEGQTGFYHTPFLSSSVFGFHEARPADPSDYTWETNEKANLQVYLVRNTKDSPDARFVIENQDGSILLESDYVKGIYDNQHWNLSLRIKPDTYPYANVATNTTPSASIEFYAVNHNFGELENEILLTASVSYASGSAYLSNPKRVYAGAHLQNFTGSVIENTDVEIGAVRAWLSYADNDVIKQHNLDPMNYGLSKSEQSDNIFTIDNKQIPSSELSILHWQFDTVTGSDGSGNFIVEDFSSGSTDTIYGWPDNIIRREHRAKGFGFGANKTSFARHENVFSMKKQLPELSYNFDAITIKGDEEINFIKDEDVSDSFFILEKSIYAIVSEEMLKTFSTIQEFSNLFGHSVDRYRMNYKSLDHARSIFFERVEQDIDFETFINYYRWIDSSISTMVEQLYPASVRHSEGVIDVVESHILERNKYQNKFGLLERLSSTEGSVRGVNELNYNWAVGHAPDYKNFINQNEFSLRIAQASSDISRFKITSTEQHFDRFVTSMWVKLESNPAGNAEIKYMVLADSNPNKEFVLETSGSHFRARSKTADQTKLHTTNNSFTLTNWNHVAFYFEGTSWSTAAVNIYVNGVAQTTTVTTPATGTDNVLATVQQMFIRQNQTSAVKLDELNIITGSLTTDQFSELYNGGKYFNVAEDFSNRLDLIASYRLGDAPGDDTATVLKDVRNNNDFVPSTVGSLAAASFVGDVFDAGAIASDSETVENTHCLWQRERKERTDITARETIRQVFVTDISSSIPNLAQPDKTIYQGSTYATRRLSKPYRVGIELKNTIHGGINYAPKKDRDFIATVVNPQGGVFPSGTPRNVFVVGTGQGAGINEQQKCDDPKPPNNKEYYDFIAQAGKYSDDSNGQPLSELDGFVYKLEGKKYYPLNLKRATVETGYNQQINRLFKSDAVIVNLHSDTTDFTNEIPMQGPFTNTHVGGHQSRHVPLNRHDTTLVTEGGGATLNNLDDQYSRPERWRLKLGEHPVEDNRDGAMGFVSPSYGGDLAGGGYIDTSREWAIYYRDGRIKRAVNVQNIQDRVSDNVLGNYNKLYQVFSTFGNKNKRTFVKAGGLSLPANLLSLPQTTQPLTRFDRQSTFATPENNLTSSEAIITTRFSAPGSRDTGTRGFLDIASGEKSVYNSINFRNLAVRGSGSEPAEEMRVVDQLNEGRGLQTLLSLHSGRFGHDPTFGSVVSSTYVTKPSFHKQHRNDLYRRTTADIQSVGLLRVSSSNDIYLETDNLGGFDTQTSTISMWLKFDGTPDSGNFTMFETNKILIRFVSATSIQLTLFDDVSSSKFSLHTFTISHDITKWNHYNFNINTFSSGNFVLYVNADTAYTSSVSSLNSPSLMPELRTVRFLTGSAVTGGVNIMNLSLFSQMVSDPTNRTTLYNHTNGSEISSIPGLTHFWSLGENEGVTVGENITNGFKFSETFTAATKQVTAIVTGSDLQGTDGFYTGEGTGFADDTLRNNALITSPLPASDFQYSWVMSTISGSNWRDNQKVFGYAPRDGLLSSSAGITEAITFPSSSALFGED